MTRSIVDAITNGELASEPTRTDPVFGFDVPLSCPGVDPTMLDPRIGWTDGDAYDAAALRLASRFRENFRQYDDLVSPAVRSAGPRV